MDSCEIIQNYGASLVREYLFRKGLKQTLQSMDTEMPRNHDSINSRTKLAIELGIEYHCIKNKMNKKPYNSLIEIIIYYIKNRKKYNYNNEKRQSSVLHLRSHSTPNILRLSQLKELHECLLEKGEDIDFVKLIKLNCGCIDMESIYDQIEKHKPPSISSFSFKNMGRQRGFQRDENGEPTVEFDEKFYYEQKNPQEYRNKEESPLTNKEKVLKSALSIKYDEKDEESKTIEDVMSEIGGLSSNGSKNYDRSQSSSKYTLNSDRSTSPIISRETSPNKYGQCKTIGFDNGTPIENIISTQTDDTSENFQNTVKLDVDCQLFEDLNLELKEETVEVINNEDETNSVDVIFTKQIVIEKESDDNLALIKMLLASSSKISKMWMGECFVFDENPNSCYGFVQHKEGCCGVLSAVGAFVIKELLFEEDKCDKVDALRPHKSQLNAALIRAISNILWQAGCSEATLALLDAEQTTELKETKDLINNITYKTYTTKSSLQNAVSENLSAFMDTHRHGCLLFLISAILSRGVKNVVGDMNGISSLINSDGYSSLELVNLLLTGQAVSNVFDNNIELKYSTIRGINKRADVGYLSLKEHFKCCKVGSYLKTPRYPIWLVNSDYHFSILFSCQKSLVSDWKTERKFILYNYDTMKSLGEEIKLSIDTTRLEEPDNSRDTKKASLENCIRTKWKDADIKWKN